MGTASQNSEAIREGARQWIVRVHDADFNDWDALTQWLETDPAHLAAYEAALDDDVWAADALALRPSRPMPPATLTEPPLSRRLFSRRRGGAIAAGVAVLAVAGGWLALDRGAPQEIATAPGEHRSITLADGTRVALNGATQIRFDPDQPRDVTLARGEALFDVRHDAAHPFVVRAGGARLVDAGTVFNVVAQDGALDVAVAEGAVLFGSIRQRIRLEAGDALSRASADAAPVLRKAEPAAIGAWRAGYLQYADAPLSQVAADLSRNFGKPIHIDAAAAAMRFSGTIMLDAPADQVLARAGPLLSVRFVAEADGWRMVPIDGARR